MSRNLLWFAPAFALILFGCSTNQTTSGPTGPVVAKPGVIQTGGGDQWETFNAQGAGVIAGADSQMWLGIGNGVERFNIATGTSDPFTVSFHVVALAVGSDGNTWFCGDGNVGKVTSTGAITLYPIANAKCSDATEGPDGAIWFTDYGNGAIGRVTTDGTISEYPTPPGEGAFWGITTGTDGGIWFTESCGCRPGGYMAMARIDPTTHAIVEYKPSYANRKVRIQLLMIVAGKDGNLYAGAETFLRQGGYLVFRLNPKTGNFAHFVVSGLLLKTSDEANIFTSPVSGTGMYRWSMSRHTETTLGKPPSDSTFIATSAAIGPDKNFYFTYAGQLAVYINKILTVSPLSATISVGNSQGFSTAENGGTNYPFTATSSNQNIATVSPVVNGAFNVTGVSQGSATITVQDAKQNVVQVGVTVQ